VSNLIKSDSEVVALYLRTLYIKEIWGPGGDEGEESPVPEGSRRTRVII
jgi:hypothetical protein